MGLLNRYSQNTPKDQLGVTDGKLAPCPDCDNCVSSQSKDLKKVLSPLPLRYGIEKSRQFLMSILAELDNHKLIEDNGSYLHYEFRSSFFRFVDDVEFYFDEVEQEIHFRSAARLGYSDLGVNRKRMREISNRYNQCLQFYEDALRKRQMESTPTL